jgi:hypothetical protein
VQIPNHKGITRYLGNVKIQISTSEITEIQSDKITVNDGSEIFEGVVRVITLGFEITLDEASTKTTDQLMRITSEYAELKVID